MTTRQDPTVAELAQLERELRDAETSFHRTPHDARPAANARMSELHGRITTLRETIHSRAQSDAVRDAAGAKDAADIASRRQAIRDERSKLTPFEVASFDERMAPVVDALDRRLAELTPTATAVPNPERAAAVAKAKAEYRELASRNAIAGAMYAERHPEVHEPEPQQ